MIARHARMIHDTVQEKRRRREILQRIVGDGHAKRRRQAATSSCRLLASLHELLAEEGVVNKDLLLGIAKVKGPGPGHGGRQGSLGHEGGGG